MTAEVSGVDAAGGEGAGTWCSGADAVAASGGGTEAVFPETPENITREITLNSARLARVNL